MENAAAGAAVGYGLGMVVIAELLGVAGMVTLLVVIVHTGVVEAHSVEGIHVVVEVILRPETVLVLLWLLDFTHG